MRAALASLLIVAACGGDKDARRATPGSDAISNTATGPVSPTAHDGDVELVATSHGGVIELTFRNTGSATIAAFTTHVFGSDVPNFDWLTVTLTDDAGVARELRFISDRDESGNEAVDLTPGATHVTRIDLAMWARRYGPELAVGHYRCEIVWDTSGEPDRYWHGKLRAVIDLTI